MAIAVPKKLDNAISVRFHNLVGLFHSPFQLVFRYLAECRRSHINIFDIGIQNNTAKLLKKDHFLVSCISYCLLVVLKVFFPILIEIPKRLNEHFDNLISHINQCLPKKGNQNGISPFIRLSL